METSTAPDDLTFTGRRVDDRCSIVQITSADGTRPLPLPSRTGVAARDHTGFEWGYVGAGPAQLALAICTAVMPRRRALQTYTAVEARLIAPIDADSWILTAEQVLAVVRADQSRWRRWP